MTTSKSKTIGIWVLRVLLGLAFLGAGIAKLTGAPPMVAIFTKIGMDPWLRLLTGVIEVGSAICLLIPKLSFYAAVLLAITMLAAVGFHLTILGGNPAAPIVLFVLASCLAWLTRSQQQRVD